MGRTWAVDEAGPEVAAAAGDGGGGDGGESVCWQQSTESRGTGVKTQGGQRRKACEKALKKKQGAYGLRWVERDA
jgi:hypothetical protein